MKKHNTYFKNLTAFTVYFLFIFVDIIQAQTYNFQFFNVQEGLPQSKVNSILQDSRGFLWIGTAGGGICKFDGKNFIEYNAQNGTAGDIITDITEDLEKNIWFSTSWGGVTKYNGRKFTIYNEDINNDKIEGSNVIFCDSKGKVWISNKKQIHIYANGVFSPIQKSFQSKITGYISSITEDSKNNILITTNEGLIYINKTDTIILTQDYGLPSNDLTCIHEDINGNYIIGTNKNGVFKLLSGSIDNKKQFEVVSYPINKNVIVSSITTDLDKNIVIATHNDGLYFVNQNNDITHIKKDNGLLTNSISTLLKDKSGNLWIGTDGNGLCKFGNIAFTYFDNIKGLNYANIFSILIDKNDIWVGTGDEGIFKFNGTSVLNFNKDNGLMGNEVRSMVRDSKGAFWFATEGGLTKYEQNKFTNYSTKDGLPTNHLRTLMIDSKNNLWIGTLGGGLSMFKNGIFTNYSENNGLLNNNVHSLFEDKEGTIWFGTGKGIHKLQKNIITPYFNNAGICNSYVSSITQDHVGNIWFGTDKCVVRYDGVDFKPITTDNGLSSNTIYFITNDKNKNIWIGTNRGLDKVSLNSYGHIETIKNYGTNEGFKGLECNSRAVYTDESNNLWFGTIKGLIKYNPKEDRLNVFHPIASIDNIKLFLEDVNWNSYSNRFNSWSTLPTNLVLNYDENHLTFEYSALNLTNPEHVQFSFKLEPFDKDWFNSTKKTSVTYSNLPSGDYTFYLKAKNNDGVWADEATSFSFTIKAPFWKTWWFYIIVIIACIYLMLKISAIKATRQEKINKELEIKVHERTLLIAQQRDEKEVLLKEIHHRVKNNLQVINSLLSLQSNYTTDEKSIALFEEAKSRIRSMALIHEKMYQSDDLAQIDVQDYIVSLTNDLISTYSINCDIFLDVKIEPLKFNIDTIIPLGLLINEIISNTLKYAYVKKDSGIITIHLSKLGSNEYELIIGDNGVGIPDEVYLTAKPSLGFELINIFIDQLDGNLEKIKTEGTVYKITFIERIR